jgi:two-component sensor histidine kinase
VVSIHWSVSNHALELFWSEIGGPPVAQPTHRGFGLRLISGALDQFNGSTETTFEPSGVVCKIKAMLPAGAISVAHGPEGDRRGVFVAE